MIEIDKATISKIDTNSHENETVDERKIEYDLTKKNDHSENDSSENESENKNDLNESDDEFLDDEM